MMNTAFNKAKKIGGFGSDAYRDDEELFNDTEFEIKHKEMDKLFPNLKFCFDCFHIDKLDNVLVKNKDAVIYYKHKCMCCDPYCDLIELIYIKRNRLITYRDFYNECCKNWKYEMCNHRFLEYIDVKNDTQIELFFGS